MPAGRYLGFDVTRNSAIRSADPEKPTLEPNMKCIGSPVAEIWPFAYLDGISVHCDHNHAAAICERMSPTLKSTGSGSLWAKISGCFPWSRPPTFWSAESEHPRLTNREIISEKNSNLCDHNPPTSQTDGRTDRRHAIARPRFALKCIAR